MKITYYTNTVVQNLCFPVGLQKGHRTFAQVSPYGYRDEYCYMQRSFGGGRESKVGDKGLVEVAPGKFPWSDVKSYENDTNGCTRGSSGWTEISASYGESVTCMRTRATMLGSSYKTARQLGTVDRAILPIIIKLPRR